MRSRSYGEAATAYRKAAETRSDEAKGEVLHAARALIDLAKYRFDGGDYQDSAQLNRIALDGIEYYLGPSTPTLRHPLEQMVRILRAGKRHRELGKFERWLDELPY